MRRAGLPRAMCVYRIWDRESGMCYVGSTVCFQKRVFYHRYKLKYGSHHAKRLQAAWNARPEAFEFQILEPVNYREELHAREQRWIDFFQAHKPGHGYNGSHYAGLPYGPRLPEWVKKKIGDRQRGRVAPEETRRRMSLAKLGKKNAPSHTLNISRAFSFFVGEKLEKLLLLRAHGYSAPALARVFNCDRHTVSNALRGKQLACAHIVDPIPLGKRTTGRYEGFLSFEQKMAVIAYLVQGVSPSNAGRHFGVSRGVIDNVKTWADRQGFAEAPLWWTAPREIEARNRQLRHHSRNPSPRKLARALAGPSLQMEAI